MISYLHPCLRQKCAMAASAQQDVTTWLLAWSEGDQSALERLVPAVYAELHRIAHHYMSQERTDHVLQTTALVNEAYIRLVDSRQQHWRNRAHFLAVSAHVMRQILVDFARSRHSRKRGGKIQQVTLHEAQFLSDEKDIDLIALNDALDALAAFDKRKSQVVELHFFGGLGMEEIAEVLKVARSTVLLDLSFAKAWLGRELRRK
jgi:RNA polymerase sigma-70 factor (ECF subfamily)